MIKIIEILLKLAFEHDMVQLFPFLRYYAGI